MRPVELETVSEGVDEGLQLVDAIWQVVGGVELVAPAGLGALDGAVEVGPFGGRTTGSRPLSRQWSSKTDMNSDPPSTWTPLTGKGAAAMSLARRALAALAEASVETWPRVHLATVS